MKAVTERVKLNTNKHQYISQNEWVVYVYGGPMFTDIGDVCNGWHMEIIQYNYDTVNVLPLCCEKK